MRCPALYELPPPPDPMTVWPWTRGSGPLRETVSDGRPWPLITIVLLSFNQGRFVEHAVRSVLLQGYPRLELIIMDGGSSDDTLETIAKYEPWMKRWVSEPDSGPADALNKGFRIGSGELFGFLNADDFYLPGCLAQAAEAFSANPAADVVSGHGYFANACGELGMPTFSDRWNLKRFCYGACVLLQPATFFRRSIFERVHGFSQNTRTCWDMELWADMALAGANFHTTDKFIAAFRLHPHSITGSAELRKQRVQESLGVMERTRGLPASAVDRLFRLVHRALKFARHPRRTVRQRIYFYSTLQRWTL